ncbi:peptidoglycan editing factor PgeF [Desulfosporosinus sp. BICA1-9]|uniref:peptidoglycan editing factor PgeF n=1 Tax=Desulfosporosinus sp. BICA1-9 TaxID=1531958 RepID=UPI0005F0E2FD|nr:peptidoglycan editing factor PgeF [Desulfosporosinus sp. BICA1-9]KJS50865.1 MAG: multicopper polyphenol oxidase [Peptococcaceae bacterium BRH_c23]KJS79407.1 MAG: multicopper polyphenol oxidase [Desulfosporosinus sp. BICA1-9]HBW34253.1 peptidoglycan editing factor PgeF [Desulfosporosinus sp.]
MNWKWLREGNLTYLTLPKWQAEGINLGFSTRVGGAGQVPYDTFNLGLHVGDDPVAVLENRGHWIGHWKVPWSSVVVGEQVHGTNVLWVHEEDGGRGVRELETAIPGVDGLLTQQTLGLMAFFADCVPLYFYYPDLKAVGIAHAGWKGTAQKIGQKVIERFEEAGGRTENAWLAIGPSIGPCCYSVDERVAEQFRSNYHKTPFLHPQEDGHYLLDLWEANRGLFLEKGVRPENIDVAAICTADNTEWFFSHRRDGARTGRMAGWISIRGAMLEAGGTSGTEYSNIEHRVSSFD